ncbi:hypothetical protein JKP88DRAFT_320327 [Tribonema minus]|uniref:Plastid lipid-associated protein/fibrillin conserved domain-containing protein n=1 Tax=Tribonema minus TaxID=303371 RepID=A0A835Z4A1_9STRA|nr:hypothetical protein JKP88DRAFT_320327 [Tribonema minus]
MQILASAVLLAQVAALQAFVAVPHQLAPTTSHHAQYSSQTTLALSTDKIVIPPSDAAVLSDAGARRLAKQAFEDALRSGVNSDIDDAIRVLCELNPTPAPGLATQAAKGRWVVCHAPHIAAGGILLQTKFVPEYWFDGQGNTSSYVKFTSSIFGSGWLNADGIVYSADDGQAVVIEFKRYWMDRGTADPSLTPDVKRGASQMDSVIQAAGEGLFIKPLSYFPIKYLDEDLCVFDFPPLNTRIAARRYELPLMQ